MFIVYPKYTSNNYSVLINALMENNGNYTYNIFTEVIIMF